MKRTIQRLAQVPWHPPLFAATWVAHAWVAASPSPWAAGRSMLVALAAAVALTLMGRALLRSWHRGALAATGLLLTLTVGRDISLVIGNVARALPAWETLTLGALFGLLAAGALVVLRPFWMRTALANTLTGYLNVAVALIAVLVLAQGLGRGSFNLGDLRQGDSLSHVGALSGTRTGPDIYVILLDGYPRGDALRAAYGFDNSAFLAGLRARGFWVDPDSHSNYLITELSFTSFFNMSQLPEIDRLSAVLSGARPAQPTARRVLNDNVLFEDLRDKGYTIVSYAIPYESPELRQADVFIESGGLNEFERSLIASSFILDLADLVNRDAVADDMRAQVRSVLATLPSIAGDTSLGQRFVFAHVLAPHSPFLFGPDGDPITSGLPHRQQDWVAPGALTEAQFRDLLVGEIQYLDGEVLDAIDHVMSSSAEPPVVVVMSDHGVRERPLDPETVTPTQLDHAFASLFAAYTPGRPHIFGPGTTPAQVMAKLLNAYFGESRPVPSDEQFVSTGSDPYELIARPGG